MQFRFPLSRCERHAHRSIDPYALRSIPIFRIPKAVLYPLVGRSCLFIFFFFFFLFFFRLRIYRANEEIAPSHVTYSRTITERACRVGAFKNGAIGMTFREIAHAFIRWFISSLLEDFDLVNRSFLHRLGNWVAIRPEIRFRVELSRSR